METILKAAIHYDNGKLYKKIPRNLLLMTFIEGVTGFVSTGMDHGKCLLSIGYAIGIEKVDSRLATYGFVTSTGRFVNRYDAATIAFDTGQISKLKDKLNSQDLRNF